MEVEDVNGRAVEPWLDPPSELSDPPFDLTDRRSDDGGGSFLRYLKLDWIRVDRLVCIQRMRVKKGIHTDLQLSWDVLR